ncbi:GntR family transcriptional regulator [Larsenimonas suaedae]|uniref:GntR family transcriptional regulator n=1 Tax=Larsenimonas suaedae TaxID=1851019 RepID=A0ABU1H0A2_9GAMM|nr:GntR family transcriptional regulator [Larsenimonas suaedae]MCM2973684.1 GntR family transcriptional regulator [Larsenimonas suaedae]MDR5897182.1 GntR family transcriptional regulator [Larsenimonas suaedae]
MTDPLARIAVHPGNTTPLYRQLSNQLARAIELGEWRSEDALPSERLLAERVGVSRITARKALERLVEQGLIVRTHGSGTFIAPRVAPSLSRLTSFSEQLARRGFTPRSHWLDRHTGHANLEERLHLDLGPNDPVVHLKRLRLADDIVVAVEESCLPARFIPEPDALEASLYAYLEHCGTPIVRARQSVSAVNADEALATLARVAPGSALLKVTRLGYLTDGSAAELTTSYCRTDYYDFVVELGVAPKES